MIQENIFVVLMILKHLLGWKWHVKISDFLLINRSFLSYSIAAKPLYDFYKELPPKMEVFRTKQTVLECHVNDPNAPVKWYKNGVPIDVSISIERKWIDHSVYLAWKR